MVRRRTRWLFTDPRGPDATEAIWTFFAHTTANQGMA